MSIWDEKPNAMVWEWDESGIAIRFCYSQRAMDTWLEKLKAYIENLLILIDGHEDSIGRLTEKVQSLATNTRDSR